MMRNIFWVLMGFLGAWIILFGFYIFLEFSVDRKYINYQLLLEESFKDLLYPYFLVVFFKFLLAKRDSR